jgi:hypothetical protein
MVSHKSFNVLVVLTTEKGISSESGLADKPPFAGKLVDHG